MQELRNIHTIRLPDEVVDYLQVCPDTSADKCSETAGHVCGYSSKCISPS